MSTNSSEHPILDLRIAAEAKLEQLGWGARDGKAFRITEQRLADWALKAICASGKDPEVMRKLLDQSKPERRWWLLRQFLPQDAWEALNRKLDKELSEVANHVDSRVG